MGVFYTRDGKPPTPDELLNTLNLRYVTSFSSKTPNGNGEKIEDKLEIAFEDVFSKQKIPYTYTKRKFVVKTVVEVEETRIVKKRDLSSLPRNR